MILRAEGIAKWYYRKGIGKNRFFALQETDFVLEEGSLTVLTGRSGSGKTTLVQILAGLLKPDTGTVKMTACTGDREEGMIIPSLYDLDDTSLSVWRNRHLQMIPQGYSALPGLTVLENIMLPLELYDSSVYRRLFPDSTDPFSEIFSGPGERRERAADLMKRLGIGELSDVYPASLSGGERRRMAVARAVMASPDILLADEPTGDLDDENTAAVLGLFKEMAEKGTAVLMVTHEADGRRAADRILRMDTGTLQEVPGYA